MAEKRPYPSFLIFRDKEGNWRWNYAGPGGRILATSSQAYSRGAGCVRAIQLLKASSDVPIVGRPEDLKVARERAAARRAAAAAGGGAAAIAGGAAATGRKATPADAKTSDAAAKPAPEGAKAEKAK